MTDASDLYYMRARYYNPVAKRFLSPDTQTGYVTNPQSQNLYTYCEGNPVAYVDPMGHLLDSPDEEPVDYSADYFVEFGNGIIIPAWEFVKPNEVDVTWFQAGGPAAPETGAVGYAICRIAGKETAERLLGKVLGGAGKGLSGKWVKANESMSEASRAYQRQITGKDDVWLQNGVKYDDMRDGMLIEIKHDYESFFDKSTGEFYDWFRGAEGLVDQARRQIEASEGAPIIWFFSDEAFMNATERLFQERRINGIKFIYEPLR